MKRPAKSSPTPPTPPASTKRPKPAPAPATRVLCPYLDTIDRHVLDFDFEKVCSVTLSNQNVYGCLVCGKYFQGRGESTPAHTHSVQAGHYVFINLTTGRIYCLPDNYEVVDSSLDDIKYNLFPRFAEKEVQGLGKNTALAKDIFGASYLPGFVGMNNLKNTDFVNVVVQSLTHVDKLRDFFLHPRNYHKSKSQVVHKFAQVMAKVWSGKKFKGSVSPHELVQEISKASKKRFRIGKQSDAVQFLAWLLNELHKGLGGTRAPRSSIIYECFQGEVQIITKTVIAASSSLVKASAMKGRRMETHTDVVHTPCLFLACDLPDSPVFKDSHDGKGLIPQIPLFNVLSKYDGETFTDIVKPGKVEKKQYIVTKLPHYLIMHMKRFRKNNWYYEKNPTIVNFPVKNLEMRKYTRPRAREVTGSSLEALSTKELVSMGQKYGITNAVEKEELIRQIRSRLDLSKRTTDETKFNLLSNVCHETALYQEEESKMMDPLQHGSYKVHLRNKANDQWYEIQDLHVREVMPQQITVSETYLLFYERM